MHASKAVRYSRLNKDSLKESNVIGCYHCIQTMKLEDITKWVDGGKTAICPFCNADTVLGDACGYEITVESLRGANDFGPESQM